VDVPSAIQIMVATLGEPEEWVMCWAVAGTRRGRPTWVSASAIVFCFHELILPKTHLAHIIETAKAWQPQHAENVRRSPNRGDPHGHATNSSTRACATLEMKSGRCLVCVVCHERRPRPLGRADCLFVPSVFFSGSLGRFNVSMRRPRHCPSHFPRFLNVSARGFADTLKGGNLCLQLWGHVGDTPSAPCRLRRTRTA
jgi:hypothetical protein